MTCFRANPSGRWGGGQAGGAQAFFVTPPSPLVQRLAPECVGGRGAWGAPGQPPRGPGAYCPLPSSRSGAVARGGGARARPNPPERSRAPVLPAWGGRFFFRSREPNPVCGNCESKSKGGAPPSRFGCGQRAGGTPLATAFSGEFPGLPVGETRTCRVFVDGLMLVPGTYSLGVAVGLGDERSSYLDFDFFFDVMSFEVAAHDGRGEPFGVWLNHFGPIRASSSDDNGGARSPRESAGPVLHGARRDS